MYGFQLRNNSIISTGDSGMNEHSNSLNRIDPTLRLRYYAPFDKVLGNMGTFYTVIIS